MSEQTLDKAHHLLFIFTNLNTDDKFIMFTGAHRGLICVFFKMKCESYRLDEELEVTESLKLLRKALRSPLTSLRMRLVSREDTDSSPI